MYSRLDKAHRALPAILGVVTLADVGVLLVWDVFPQGFPARSHACLASLFWAANQFWPDSPQATLYNDIAIALFVLDVFLVMIGWPPTSPDSSFAETCP